MHYKLTVKNIASSGSSNCCRLEIVRSSFIAEDSESTVGLITTVHCRCRSTSTVQYYLSHWPIN